MFDEQMIIEVTNNYSIFKMLKGNRNISLLNVNRIKRSIEEKYIKNPIIVNENMEVIDGQHRLFALEQLGLPVHYIIIPGLGVKECQLMNCNSKAWGNSDYLNGYIEMGYSDYILLKQFQEEFSYLGLSVCEALLAGVDGGAGGKSLVHNAFKNGTYKIKDYERAKKFAIMLKDFEGTIPYGTANFTFACIKLFQINNYDHNIMMARLENNMNVLRKEPNIKSYIISLINIYNYRTTDKNRLVYDIFRN